MKRLAIPEKPRWNLRFSVRWGSAPEEVSERLDLEADLLNAVLLLVDATTCGAAAAAWVWLAAERVRERNIVIVLYSSLKTKEVGRRYSLER